MFLQTLAWLVGAYLLGSVNFALLLYRFAGLQDPRLSGSGNAGTSNAFRSGHKLLALAILVLDLGRAVAVGLAARSLFPWSEGYLLVGVMLVIGNSLPVFHRFRGGKGIAASIGFTLGAVPVVGGVGLGVWVAVFSLTRRSSVASLVMVGSYPITGAMAGMSSISILTLSAFTIVAFVSHRDNVKRLFLGKEPPLRARGDKKQDD